MLEKEKRIKEQRLIEATSKDYLGIEGKFGHILKYLGEPILSYTESGNYFSSNEMPDYLNLDSGDELPVLDIESNVNTIGYMFDGLSRGMHLNITYINEDKKIEVYYKGYLVYREIENDLDTFFPLKEWEEIINKLFILAKTKKISSHQEVMTERENQGKKIKENFLKLMYKKWKFN